MKSTALQFRFFLLLLIVFTAQASFAEAPTTIEKMPIYGGMKLLSEEKAPKENAWIETANCEWYFRNTKSSMSTLHIMFQDLSIDEVNGKYELNTEIIIEVIHYNYEI